MGLPEDVEGPLPSLFYSQLLVEVLGSQVLSSLPELDRAHRSLSDLIYNGHRVRFYEDYSPDVVKSRAEFKAVMTELYKRGY
ncbi:hypothetical protein XENOCAPTIV_027176 [Xenoophorus captivus]|uniref:Uncharacterized protein n=1 Tax=Xenoophorus captivus TaxID=1517983 RepID=A0ABV0S0H8_9TELE